METGKQIQLRRALILGNFYNRKVKIIQLINGVQEAIIDVIIGIKPDVVLTKSGVSIEKNNIQSIYQI